MAILAVAPVFAQAGPDSGETAFRATYEELVETNTTLSAGSCTLAPSAWRPACTAPASRIRTST